MLLRNSYYIQYHFYLLCWVLSSPGCPVHVYPTQYFRVLPPARFLRGDWGLCQMLYQLAVQSEKVHSAMISEIRTLVQSKEVYMSVQQQPNLSNVYITYESFDCMTCASWKMYQFQLHVLIISGLVLKKVYTCVGTQANRQMPYPIRLDQWIRQSEAAQNLYLGTGLLSCSAGRGQVLDNITVFSQNRSV